MVDIALSGFLSGFATAYFALQAFLLFRREDASRLQQVVACIFVQWALFNLKDFLLTIPDYKDAVTQNVLILVDGMSFIGYTLFIYELIHPGWSTWRKAGLMLLAYLPFFVAFSIWPHEVVIRCYMVCLFVAGTIIFLLWYRQARRYARYIRANYSNLDHIDISWLRVVAFFFVVCQLLWVVIAVVQHPLTDCLYYILSIILWQITLEYVLRQQPVTIEEETQGPIEPESVREYGFAQLLPSMIEKDKLYLNPTLSLKDLAASIGTNRTYLSDYFTHVLNTTFYNYINSIRIEKKSIPMLQDDNNYTIEVIAKESGFQSLSTFRRAFVKQVGVTPSKYRKQIKG